MESIIAKLKHLMDIGISPEFEEAFKEDDLSMTPGNTGTDRFLGIYSKQDVEDEFQKSGIIPSLHEKGFLHLEFVMDTSDPFVHSVKVTDKSLESKPLTSRFLIDLFVRRRDFKYSEFKTFTNHKDAEHMVVDYDGEDVKNFFKKHLTFELHMSVVEWLSMQNPLSEFLPERPQLPGQKHPGLGVGRRMVEMLSRLAKEKKEMDY